MQGAQVQSLVREVPHAPLVAKKKKEKKKKERDYDMYKHTQTCAHLFRVAMVVLMVAFNTTFSISLDFSP